MKIFLYNYFVIKFQVKGCRMKKVVLSVLAVAVAALVSGCTPSCEAQKPAPVVVKPAPVPVVVDAKEAAVK